MSPIFAVVRRFRHFHHLNQPPHRSGPNRIIRCISGHICVYERNATTKEAMRNVGLGQGTHVALKREAKADHFVLINSLSDPKIIEPPAYFNKCNFNDGRLSPANLSLTWNVRAVIGHA
ncbi:MAG: hypothetical protein AB7O43_20575 [Hyphomicrobiaceae bacterium]